MQQLFRQIYTAFDMLIHTLRPLTSNTRFITFGMFPIILNKQPRICFVFLFLYIHSFSRSFGCFQMNWTELNILYMLNIWLCDDLFLSRMHVSLYIGDSMTPRYVYKHVHPHTRNNYSKLWSDFFNLFRIDTIKMHLKWWPLQITSPLIFVYHSVLPHFRLAFICDSQNNLCWNENEI